MAGKAYTMREMRSIVEYLTEHKAYSEIKGRKMWMEFANSQHTTRTWQSLKETFLKRILPDLHNPYYKLTMDQVRSFREGCDVAEKEKKNRLDLRPINEDSIGSNEDKQLNDKNSETKSNDVEAATSNANEVSTSNIENELEKATGEAITPANIQSRNRSSADTLVLEYENVEDVQRALESPQNQTEKICKSFKDRLSFEPMTPLLKELLEDFETESETSDKEHQSKTKKKASKDTNNTVSKPMRVDEPKDKSFSDNDADSLIIIEDSEDVSNSKAIADTCIEQPHAPAAVDDPDKNDNNPNGEIIELTDSQDNKNVKIPNEKLQTEHIKQETLPEDQDVRDNVTEFVTAQSTDKTVDISNNNNNNNIEPKSNSTINTVTPTQNTGNTSSDTLLPNNQEGLCEPKKNEISKQISSLDKTDNESKAVNRKRSSSTDSHENKKQKKTKTTNESDDLHARVTPVIELNTDTPNDTASIIAKNTEIPKDRVIEINTNTSVPNTAEQIHAGLNRENISKPATSTRKDQKKIDDTKDTLSMETDADKNPCLLNVSLFDDELKNTQYSDSESDEPKLPPEENKKELTDIKSTKTSCLKNTETQTKETNVTSIPAVQKTILKQQKETQLNAIEVMELNEVPQKFDILKSNVENNQQKKDQRERVNETKLDRKSVMLQKEKTLANIFGFAHGVAAASSSRKAESRKRRISHKKSYRHRRHISISSNSSDWTSESDSDSYVSPPRGRKNRHTRKYLKPKTSRILQDPEEGMLFVMFGKNMYPIVKDGKHIKNFLTYRPDSGDEVDESYWRQKYVEEKKRVDEYKKLLQKNERNDSLDEMPSTSRNNQAHQPQKPCVNGNDKHASVEKSEVKNEKMVLKIACKSGLEYCLEGGWTQISNAMPQVVQILRTETDIIERKQSPNINNNVVIKSPNTEAMEVSSGVSTPVIPIIDPEVREKVNKIETEIFKEIEEREKEIRDNVNKIEADIFKEIEEMEKEVGEAATNVTKRRAQPRKVKSPSLTIPDKPAKRTRVSKASTKSKETIFSNSGTSEQKIETNGEKPAKNKRTSKLDLPSEVQNTELIERTVQLEKPKTHSRTEIKPLVETEHTIVDHMKPDNLLDEHVTEKESHISKEQTATTRKSERIPKEKDNSRQSSVASSSKTTVPIRSSPRKRKTATKNDDTDSSVSDVKRSTRKSTSKTTSEIDIDDENARFIFPPAPKNKKSARVNRKRSMPQIHVISPENITENSIGYQDSNSSLNLSKWKRKISFSTQKNRRIRRRKSYPILLHDLSTDSNDSVYFVPLRKSQTTLSSYIYKTDSYRQLFGEKKTKKKLVPIDEVASQESDENIRHFHLIAKDSDKTNTSMAKEVGSSSNVSLPLSPELSIVEKLTISTEMIRNDNHPILNEKQCNASDRLMDFSEFMISNVDVSFPLMDQSCELQMSKLIPNKTPSDSLNKETNVTVSQSLDQRLQDLLLESGKKTIRVTKNKKMALNENRVPTRKTRSKNNENAMDVDETKTSLKTDVNKLTTRRITHSKNNENAIEANAFKIPVKRRSSTPRKKKTVQNTIAPSNAIIEEERMETCSYKGRKSCPPVITLLPIEENDNNCDEVLPATKKGKKKKDVIKVKIQKPKSRQKIREKSIGASTITVFTDSGINETDTISGFFLKDDSVDLIHNHSETCLLQHECLDESVKLIDKSKSIISLNSTAVSDVESELMKLVSDGSNLSGVEFGSPHASSTSKTSQQNKCHETDFLSPQTINSSLITEDLSNEIPSNPSQWYLLSEDESTLPITNVSSFGANLNQIFPITCTVPNLSTITEISKDSRKQSLDDSNICDM